MSAWLTRARNLALAWVSLALFAGCATQTLAALHNYAPHLGEPIAYWYGLPLYDAWDFLRWGFASSPAQPWNALLAIGIACVVAVAAFGVFVIASGFAPITLPSLKFRSGFQHWNLLRQRGLLGASGLALGAVRRHTLAKLDVVTLTRGNSLIVGDSDHTDDALIAALSRWQGALVFVDARGLAAKLARSDAIRLAPGRSDSARYNPLFALRGGVHAWEDARRLASAFLQTSDQGAVAAFALLILDQLLTASLEGRTLAALRRRLTDRQRVLAELCAAWAGEHIASDPPLCEMARMAQFCSANPHATLDALARIDAALSLFADGAYANATSTHQFRFADLVAGDGPSTLIIASPRGEATRAAPLIAAMLAQLVAECASSADQDHLGRRKKRELLIVIEAEACHALGAARARAHAPPLLISPHASTNGCHALFQARCVGDAARWADNDSGSFDAIAALGPQTEASAAALSAGGGAMRTWRRVKQYREAWREWLLPEWERASRPIVTANDLRGAPAGRVHLFVKHFRPIGAWALSGGEGRAHFADSNALPHLAHDWSAPPLPRAEPPTSEAHPLTARTKPIGAQIRKALTRKAPPQVSRAKSP